MPSDPTINAFLDEAFLNRLEKLKIISQRGVKSGTSEEHAS